MLEAQGRLLHGGKLLENVSMRTGTSAAIKFRHLMPVLPGTLCCPCCDTSSLPSVCVILRTGPYCYFSSQKFLSERLFLKELWWLMQSSSLFPAISSSPMTFPACSVERFVSSISLAQALWQVAQLYPTSTECWGSAGNLVPGTISTEIREKKAVMIWEAFQETAQGSWRKCDSWHQASFGNEVNRGFRCTANTVLV